MPPEKKVTLKGAVCNIEAFIRATYRQRMNFHFHSVSLPFFCIDLNCQIANGNQTELLRIHVVCDADIKRFTFKGAVVALCNNSTFVHMTKSANLIG